MSYPAKWDTTNKDKRIIFMAVEKRKNDKDVFKENFTVYTVTLDKAMEMNIIVESAAAAFKQQGNTDKDIIEKGVKKTKKGLSYGLFKTKNITKDHTIVSSAIYFMKDKKVFVLTLSYDNIESVNYEKLYKSIIDTFEINKNGL